MEDDYHVTRADQGVRQAPVAPLPDALPCPNCGYDLRGQTVERCPECGAAYDAQAIRWLQGEAYRAVLYPCLDTYLWLVATLILVACWLVILLLRGLAPLGGMEYPLVWYPAVLTIFFAGPALSSALQSRVLGHASPPAGPRVFVLDEMPAPAPALGMGRAAVAVLLVLSLFSAASIPTIVTAAVLITVGLVGAASYRGHRAERTHQLEAISGKRAEKLRRARAVMWTLALIDVGGCAVVWCLV